MITYQNNSCIALMKDLTTAEKAKFYHLGICDLVVAEGSSGPRAPSLEEMES